jgi:hypothetical protein
VLAPAPGETCVSEHLAVRASYRKEDVVAGALVCAAPVKTILMLTVSSFTNTTLIVAAISITLMIIVIIIIASIIACRCRALAQHEEEE